MDTVRYAVFIDARHAARLSAIRKKGSRAASERAWELADQGMRPVDARLEARRQCRELWPPLGVLVARAVEQRLSEPDLAGPWPPLTTREEEFMSLSGRWPSRNYVGTLVKRAYDVPSDLLLRMRAASYRVSEGPLAELEDRGLTFARLDLSDEDQELRDALVDKVFPVPRIVREALENFGPWLRPDATEAGEL